MISHHAGVRPPNTQSSRSELSEMPFPSSKRREATRYPLLSVVALATVYFVFARLGLGVATVGKSITLVWPSTGIALASLLLFGWRLWPGVALGALLVNALTPGVPFLSACGIAVGNTLEAVLGVFLLRRAGFRHSVERVRDVVLLLVIAAGLSTMVSATLGCFSLWLGGVIAPVQLGAAWRVWWVGDLMGDVIVAPLLLVAFERARHRKLPSRPIEALALCASLFAVSLVGFGGFQSIFRGLSHPYVIFPVLIWAALRFRLVGAVGANLIVSGSAVWATVTGRGPFVGGTLNENLVQVHAFMGVAALTTLILGAAAAERFRAIRVRDQFLSMASHELRTPLTPMKLQVHLLERILNRAPGDLVDQVRSRLSLFERQIDRMAKLVDELLDVSRVDAGQLSLTFEEFELGSLVRETVEAFGEELAAARCSIEMRLDKEILGCWDRLRVQQVVSNLLSNAIKYAAGQPIRVSVDLDLALQARISVADSGIGIPKEQQQLIFAAFERGTYAPRVGGLGLGLYIASKIVEAHHGSIEVNSNIGLGSTFTVRLPLRPPASPA